MAFDPKQYAREYYQKHKERLKKYQAKYNEANRDEINYKALQRYKDKVKKDATTINKD